jgi:glutamate-5-semialdehyde dehydrogenase
MIEQLLTEAKLACRQFQIVGKETKIQALEAIADALVANKERIIKANNKDIETARSNGMRESMIDRLLLNEERIEEMAQGCRQVAHLDDPVNQVIR